MHTCHAIGCETPCPPEFLCCPKHWKMVPFPIQREVWRNYRIGQCDDKKPSGAWMIAAERAIVCVAVKEKRMTPAEAERRVQREIALFGGNPPQVLVDTLVEIRASATTVVNKERGEAFDVYIGRGSIYGNPYSHVRSSHKVIYVPDRHEAIRRYRRWLLKLETVAWCDPPTFEQIMALKGKRLGCSCKPENCHGDVLVEWINAGKPVTEEDLMQMTLNLEARTDADVQGDDHVRDRDLDVEVDLGSDGDGEAEDPRSGVRSKPDLDDEAGDGAPEGPPPLVAPLKWPGSKKWAAAYLAARVHEHLAPGRFYYEPFLGSASVALAMPAGTRMVLSDYCAPVSAFWWWIRNKPAVLHAAIEGGEDWTVSEENYYRIREAFNADMFSIKSAVPAARFLWLNRTCFNGVYRENGDGKFNVPFGKKTSVTMPTLEHLMRLSQHLQTANILLACDFEAALRGVRAGDVVYADPPYHDVYDSYVKGGFGEAGQVRLAKVLGDCVERGATVFMTNSATMLIRELYEGKFAFEDFDEPRSVAARGSSRQKVGCILAIGVRA